MTEFQDKTQKMRGLASATRLCLSCSRTFEPGKFSMALSGTDATCPQDGSVLMPLPELDTPLVGNYLYKGLLGVGGMGVVFKALNPYLDRLVAIKFVKGKRYDSKQLTRFMQEGKLLSKLVHPNLVSVLDFGANDIGEPYMVMEYLDGQSLAQMIEKIGTVPLDQALDILSQTCLGLAHAHKFGAVHRDIKPSNIFISNKGRNEISVKLLDFGIAKLCFPEDPVSSADLTRTGEIFGSPLYMSPEQALGKSVDERSDIYNLGCVFYEMMTGTPPHVGKTAMETVFKHVSDDPQPLRQRAPKKNYSVVLEDLLTCLLAKAPEDRVESADKLVQIFQAIGDESSPEIRELSRKAKQINSQSVIGRGAGKSRGSAGLAASTRGSGSVGGPNFELLLKIGLAMIVLISAGAVMAYFLFRPAEKKAPVLVAASLPSKTVELDDNDTTNSIVDVYLHPDAKSLQHLIKKELQRGSANATFDKLTFSEDAFKQIVTFGSALRSLELNAMTGLSERNLAHLKALHLVRVMVRFGDMTDGGLVEISKYPYLSELILTEVHDVSGMALACLKDTHLKLIHLEGFKIDEKVWPFLFPRPDYNAIEFYGSTHTDFGESVHVIKCRQAIPLIAQCKNLRSLALISTDIEDSDVTLLLPLTNLASLRLGSARKVTDGAIDTLLKFQKVTELDISGTQISARGTDRILHNPRLKTVRMSSRYRRATPYIEQQIAIGRAVI